MLMLILIGCATTAEQRKEKYDLRSNVGNENYSAIVVKKAVLFLSVDGLSHTVIIIEICLLPNGGSPAAGGGKNGVVVMYYYPLHAQVVVR